MTPSDDNDPPFDPDSTYTTVEIVDGRPHDVVIWNAKDSAREIAVQIRKRQNKSENTETVFDNAFGVPADAALEFRLIEPATYIVDISVASDDGHKELRIQQEEFDCNSHKHQLAVRPDGSIDVSGLSTTKKCDPESDN